MQFQKDICSSRGYSVGTVQEAIIYSITYKKILDFLYCFTFAYIIQQLCVA